MAYVQADLDAVKTAIATGASMVKYGNNEVKYHSLADLLKIQGVIEAELNGTRVKTRRYGVYSKT